MSTLPWLDGIVKWDPDQLSRLEYFLGPFDIDWNGGEASGIVVRPQLRAGATIGGVRKEVLRVAVTFELDREAAIGSGTIEVAWLELDLDLGHATVAHHLARRFASTHAIQRDGRTLTAYGNYLLNANADGSAHLEWARDGAPPARVEGARAALLELLLDRMICGTSAHAIYIALLPATGGTGCYLFPPAERGGAVTLAFRPPVDLQDIARWLRLEGFVGARTRLGAWELDVSVDAAAQVNAITVSPYRRT